MPSFDFGQKISAQPSLFDSELTAQSNGASIDVSGFEGVAVATHVGGGTISDISATPLTLTFFEADEDNFSEASQIDSKYVVKNPSINAHNSVFVASIKPTKRYVWAQVSEPNDGNVQISTIGVLGYAAETPT